MDHYLDIELRKDPEFPPSLLLAALYGKLHRMLAARNITAIGVSFPGYDARAPQLGARLRLHGELGDLSSMLENDWLIGLRDQVALTQPLAVPASAQHRRVGRVQVKSSPERVRRRLMRRLNLSEQEARQRIPDESACVSDLPFIQVRSTSTGQTFRLFIEHGPIRSSPIVGKFNAYGFSKTATIPWF